MGSPLIWFGNAAKFLKSQIVIPGSTSGTLTIQPSASTTSYSLTMPSAQGGSTTALVNDGSGGLSWTAFSAATTPATYTMTTTATTSNPTSGTVSVNIASYVVINKTCYIWVTYRQTSAGTAGSGTYLFNIPGGLTIDNTKIGVSTSSANSGRVGSAGIGNAGVSGNQGTVWVYDTTHLAIIIGGTNDFAAGGPTADFASTNLLFGFQAIIPIV